MSSSNAIFISYRRSDSEDITGRIYDRLKGHFDQDLIFRDLDSIPLGNNFQQVLQQSVNDCRVLIAVIGPDWLKVLHERLQRSGVDWVRTEIAIALKRGNIPVIPLLVGRAKMPGADDLPDDLKGLNPMNAAQARPDPDFHNDMDRLIKSLEDIVGKPQAAAKPLAEEHKNATSKRTLSALDKIKLDTLEKRQEVLLKKYQAAANQLNKLLGDADKVTIQEQIDGFEQELKQVASDIAALEA